MNENFVSKALHASAASAVLSTEESNQLLKVDSQRGSDPWPDAGPNPEYTDRPYLSPQASVNASLLHADCAVEARVSDSILCSGVSIGRDSVIHESLIMPGAVVGRGVTIHRAFIGEGAFIDDGARIVGSGERLAVVQPGEAITVMNSIQLAVGEEAALNDDIMDKVSY
jgi:glucose-1-phosphate adenylyltransferase